MGGVTRTLVAWCPDWPVVSAGLGAEDQAAVLSAGRVAACSAAARERGVGLGMRRRTAEARCAGLVVLQRDEALEARAFESVARAVATIAPDLEITRPGLLSLATRGPARYHGGEEPLVTAIAAIAGEAAAVTCGVVSAGVCVGVADGPFAAALAARRNLVVPVGGSPGFLAPFPVGVLGHPELADLLVRLGVPTLGEFARLDPTKVAARFGPDGEAAHRLARGLDARPLRTAPPPAEYVVAAELDPPAERADIALFAGRGMGDDLCARLAGRGLVCTLLTIEAETEHGEALSRHWRAEVAFGAEAMGERLRWQLDGWLAGTVGEERPTAGITRLSFRASEVAAAGGEQAGLWGGVTEADRRAVRGLDRLRGMLGEGGVLTAALTGGRGPADRVRLVSWGDGATKEKDVGPWPGRHPSPAPALVHAPARGAEVRDRERRPVEVSGRGRLSGSPDRVSVDGGPARAVVGWAGPWLLDERWWDPRAGRRRARFQLLLEDGTAYLCFVERNRWFVEATYD